MNLKIFINIFLKAVESVQMSSLISKHLNYNKNNDILRIFNSAHYLESKDLYLVGAGKAVFQMASEMNKLFGNRLKSGIISVPLGILNGRNHNIGNITCYEGAENNLPDKKAEINTNKIMDLLKILDNKSILIVLLSGGGSSLLTAPLSPITLDDKCTVINKLAKAGADIIELNTVRKHMSSIKGGKLSLLAYPAETIALLVSDILGDRNEYIASGPTYINCNNSLDAKNITVKYKIDLPKPVEQILSIKEKLKVPSDIVINNYVLGNNTSAITTAKNYAENMNYQTFVMSNCIHGDVRSLSFQYYQLVHIIMNKLLNKIDISTLEHKLKLLNNISLNDEFITQISTLQYNSNSGGICLVGGGESTVKINGNGKGGRNQQLALNFSLLFDSKTDNIFNLFETSILCAGTDGIDGPTDAAGAIGYDGLVLEAKEQNMDVPSFLENNDSYNFYQIFSDGKYHIKTGHTNTNVMDIHLIFIKMK